MKLALSTDHAGFAQLQKLQNMLTNAGHECTNFGPSKYDPTDDYPNFIKPAALAVTSGTCDRGIIFGSTGQGEAMVANHIKGIRCAVYYGIAMPLGVLDADGGTAKDEFEILRLSRQHNDANILSLAGRFLTQSAIEQAVTIWLATEFSGLERHQRRINAIES